MNVLIFGATGMVGQGVLDECLRADDVALIRTVGRTPIGRRDPKLDDVVQRDLFDLSTIEGELTGFDACFYCLGPSSNGMTEANYTRQTFDLTLSIADTLARLNPQMTFAYVSGAGTDSSERGRSMWARVKGRAENSLQRLPFKAVFLFRPGVIQPVNGARSKTASYRIIYTVLKPLLTPARRMMPKWVLTTAVLGQAMLAVARHGAAQPVLESPDIDAVAKRG